MPARKPTPKSSAKNAGVRAANERKPPVRRAPDAPSEQKPPVRRAPPEPGDRERAPMIGEPPARGGGRTPALGIVRGAAPPPPFAPRATASSRQRLLFDMVRARAKVQAAVQGLAPGAAVLPIAEGKWSARETLLHLHARDREVLRALDPARHGIRPSWFDFDADDHARANAEALDALRHLPWDAALRALHAGRLALIEAVERVPELPAEVWSPTHPLGALLAGVSSHDLHHADVLKRWRAGDGSLPEASR